MALKLRHFLILLRNPDRAEGCRAAVLVLPLVIYMCISHMVLAGAFVCDHIAARE